MKWYSFQKYKMLEGVISDDDDDLYARSCIPLAPEILEKNYQLFNVFRCLVDTLYMQRKRNKLLLGYLSSLL